MTDEPSKLCDDVPEGGLLIIAKGNGQTQIKAGANLNRGHLIVALSTMLQMLYAEEAAAWAAQAQHQGIIVPGQGHRIQTR